MSRTIPMRMEGDLVEAAKAVGAVFGRSPTQQLSRWARIGRELEASPGTSQRDIQRVLAGEAEYDDLGECAQAIVRAVWDEVIVKRLARLDLEAEFTKTGRPWTEADDEGNAVIRGDDASA